MLRKLLRRKLTLAKWGFIASGATMLLISVFVVFTSYYQQFLIQKTTNKNRGSISMDNRKGGDINLDENMYQNIINDYEVGQGNVGIGLYYQAIAMLNEGYLKDTLDMYTKAEKGYYNNTMTYKNTAPGLLQIHLNESGMYPGLNPIPEGPFPIENGKIIYNVPRGGLPKEGLTWEGYNKHSFAAIGQGGIRDTGSNPDIFVMQMNSSKFKAGNEGRGSHSTAGINESPSSNSIPDGRHMPDQLSVLNNEFHEMVSRSENLKKMYSVDKTGLTASFAVKHNRGSMSQQVYGIPYSSRGQTGYKPSSGSRPKRADVNYTYEVEAAATMANEINSGINKLNWKPPASITSDGPRSRAAGMILLVEMGWKFTPEVSSYYSNRHQTLFKDAWNSIYPGNKVETAEDIKRVIDRNTSTLDKELNISKEETSKIYGTAGDYREVAVMNGDSYKIGGVFKTTGQYSDDYVLGRNQIVWAYDGISVGHMFMGVTSRISWEYLMLFAMDESGIDPTNPKFHTASEDVNERNNSTPAPNQQARVRNGGFVTKDAEVSRILSLMGLEKNLKKSAYQMITGGLEASGGWYSQGKRNSLDSEGNYYRDCSSLVGYALEKVPKAKELGASRWHTTSNMYNDYKPLRDLKVTKSNWKEIVQPGDVFVRRSRGAGHTFIFIGFNDTGDTVTIPKELTYRQTDVKVKPGEFLAVESHKTGYRNGLFSRKGLSSYKIKRPVSR